MAEIKSIHGGRKPMEPSQPIIDQLEILMEEARSGVLIGFAYAVVREDGTQRTGWDGESGTRHSLGTALMMLNYRYIEALLHKDD